MPTRSGHPYLLGESNKSHTATMVPQQIATMFAKINAKLETLKIFEERLTKLKATREPSESLTYDQNPPRNNQRNNIDNPPNLDAQYLKNINIDVPTLMDVMTHNLS